MLSTLRKSSAGTFATNPKHRSTGNSSGNEVLEEHSLGPAEGQSLNVRLMAHPSSSYLDLEFVLPRRAREAKDVQKTIISVNHVAEIPPIINIFREWFKRLRYPPSSYGWIWPYSSSMSERDKAITAAIFRTPGGENLECSILVATDAHSIGINIPDIKLFVQWENPMSMESLAQHMIRAGDQTTFVVLTSSIENPSIKHTCDDVCKALNRCSHMDDETDDDTVLIDL